MVNQGRISVEGKKGKVYVPKDEVLRAEIIQLHHDVLVTGYKGR